jgi:hypothetical protein
MDIYNNCFEHPINTSFSIYFQFIFCHNHPSLDSPLCQSSAKSPSHICIWMHNNIPTFGVRVLMVVTVPECESECFELAKLVSWTFVADTTSEGKFVVSFVAKKVDLAVKCLPDLSKLINHDQTVTRLADCICQTSIRRTLIGKLPLLKKYIWAFDPYANVG